MVPIKQNLVSNNKYNVKCPYSMSPEGITVHNTANNASAANEVAYMIRNNNKVSFHYAVDDIEIVQGILENRNAWHAGDGGSGNGNRTTIGVEICYSTGDKAKFEKAQENAAEFVAFKLKEYGWGIDKVYTHKHWSGKHCPHRTLDEYGWEFFLGLVEKYLGKQTTPVVSTELYRVRKSWGDAASQLGAYSVLENAVAACEEGYSVFDSQGNVVYQKVQEIVIPTPVPTPAPIPSITVLKKGSKGNEVKELQNKLNALGYNCGKADGIFGAKTETAVKQYQKDTGLIVDGMAGPKTLEALKTAKKPEPQNSILVLKQGSKGEEVKELQNKLNSLGYNCGTADGIFGAKTTSAVKSFQKNNGLVVDGKAGPKTMEALKTAKNNGTKVKVTASALNVRAGAGTSYKVVKVVRKGQTLTIVSEKSGWGKLSDGSGWVSLGYTKKV